MSDNRFYTYTEAALRKTLKQLKFEGSVINIMVLDAIEGVLDVSFSLTTDSTEFSITYDDINDVFIVKPKSS